MPSPRLTLLVGVCVVLAMAPLRALDHTEITFKVFQSPADQIPRIDGEAPDWAIAPANYAIGMDQFVDDGRRDRVRDPKNLDVKIRVGWVKGLNRLYVLYEATDNYWDFADPGLHNDTPEIIVDGDASGGPLIPPGANTRFDLKPGEPGKLTLEFWITPFDYAGPEGPARAIESVLRENKIIGLSFIVIDYDDVTARGNNGFWILSRQRTSYGHASELCAFQLMPLEPELTPALDARWSFSVVDAERRLVAFKDESLAKS